MDASAARVVVLQVERASHAVSVVWTTLGGADVVRVIELVGASVSKRLAEDGSWLFENLTTATDAWPAAAAAGSSSAGTGAPGIGSSSVLAPSADLLLLDTQAAPTSLLLFAQRVGMRVLGLVMLGEDSAGLELFVSEMRVFAQKQSELVELVDSRPSAALSSSLSSWYAECIAWFSAVPHRVGGLLPRALQYAAIGCEIAVVGCDAAWSERAKRFFAVARLARTASDDAGVAALPRVTIDVAGGRMTLARASEHVQAHPLPHAPAGLAGGDDERGPGLPADRTAATDDNRNEQAESEEEEEVRAVGAAPTAAICDEWGRALLAMPNNPQRSMQCRKTMEVFRMRVAEHVSSVRHMLESSLLSLHELHQTYRAVRRSPVLPMLPWLMRSLASDGRADLLDVWLDVAALLRHSDGDAGTPGAPGRSERSVSHYAPIRGVRTRTALHAAACSSSPALYSAPSAVPSGGAGAGADSLLVLSPTLPLPAPTANAGTAILGPPSSNSVDVPLPPSLLGVL